MDFKRIRLILQLHRHHQYHDASSFFLILYGFFCFCCFCIASSRAADPITELKPGQKLDDGQLLVSPSHNFILGFFTKGASDGRYLGIQLNTSFGSLNPVWIANREKAIPDTNGLLSLDANGILRLVRDGENLTFLNSNPASTPISNRLTAILLDSGNFVLKEINGAGVERFLWQSFDYPADTLLPGMKLSISKSNSGRNRSLTSWASNKVLYPGAFTLGLHPNTNQLLIQRRGETYWRSGGWDGRQFQLVPHLTSRDSYSVLLKDHIKFSYVDDQDERYFSYDYSGVDLPILFWVLNSSGGLQSYEIIRQNELVSSLNLIGCNGNDGASSSAGCEKQKLPSCRTGNEQFQERRGTMEGGGPPTSPVFGNDSISDCDTRCRRNCSCIAYAPYDSESQIGCQFWFTGSRFIENAGSGSNVIYLLSSPHEGKEWWMWLIISGGVVSAMLLLVSLAYFWWKKGKREENDEDLLLEFGTISSSQEQGKGTPEFQVFSYDNIASATDNFSPTNKLGEGGFGPVYKGKLHEGQEIAVKRLSKMSGQGLKEFKNEIMLIAKLQHMNLVRLLGCSIKGEEKMLIYEYMPNKSLDSFLFDPAGRQLLDWTKRRNIIEGIAQGLLYLHKYSRLRVIHRDLKASNILLDAELNPKISDFGMAKIFGLNDSEANTNRIVGTYGYMAPEYAMEGIFSVKSDVFSFGVLLLEIISGRKNSGFNRSDSHINLIGYAWDLWQKKAGIELLDPTLASSCSEESFLRCFHVGLLCVQESAADRPTMLDVVSMLTSETASLPAPGQPAFSTARILLVEEEKDSNSKPESCSKNGLTISVMEAR